MIIFSLETTKVISLYPRIVKRDLISSAYGIPIIHPVSSAQNRDPARWESLRPEYLLESDREIPQFHLESGYQPEEGILAIELASIPVPITIRSEDFDLLQGVHTQFFTTAKRRQLLVRYLVKKIFRQSVEALQGDLLVQLGKPAIQRFNGRFSPAIEAILHAKRSLSNKTGVGIASRMQRLWL